MIISKEDFNKTMELIENNWISNKEYAYSLMKSLENNFGNTYWIKYWIDNLKCGTRYPKITITLGETTFDLKYKDNLYDFLIWEKGKGEF